MSNMRRWVVRRVAGICLLLIVPAGLASVSQAAEQSAAAPDATVTERSVSTEELKDLVSTLESDESRQALVRQLRALIAARSQLTEEESEPAGGALLAFASEISERVGGRVVEAASVVLDLPQALARSWSKLKQTRVSAAWAADIGKGAAIFVLGLAIQWAARRFVRRPQARLGAGSASGTGQHIGRLLLYTLLDLAPILVFAATVFLVLPLAALPRGVRLAAFAMINAHILTSLVTAAARLVLVPRASALRLVPMGDEAANYGYLWLCRLSAVGIYGYMLASSLPYLGVPRGVDKVAIQLIGLVVAVMVAMFILQNRATGASWLRGPDRPNGVSPNSWGKMRNWFAGGWHVLALIYLFAAYVVWAANVAGGFRFLLRGTVLTLVIIVAARLISAGVQILINRGFALSDDTKARFPMLEARANRYTSVFHMTVRVVIYGIAVLAVLQAWNIDSLGVVVSDLGKQALSSLFTIGAVFLVAFLVWEGVNAALDYQIAKAGDAARQAKLRTALPILQRILMIALAVMVALSVLSQFGINIAPLLAGAGVVGIAIGLGAQNLVKDVLKGLTILMEDSIAVGDVVALGGRTGIVETLSIGSVRLRDLNGDVYVVPFSEVTTVVNMTKDYSYAVIEASVSYREDVDRVMDALAGIGAELQADPVVGPDILEPLEIFGVDQFAESAVVIKARMKTKPIKQWAVARAFRRRMKMRFGELGIEIPFPQRTIHIAGPTQAALATRTAREPEAP